MAVYFLDNDQHVIKIVPDNGAISILQTQELPEDSNLLKDVLSVHLKNDERLFDAQYMAIKSYDGNRNAFDMYRIVSEVVPDNATEFEGVQVAPYELEGVVVEDIRPQGWTIERTTNQILKDSDWRLGYTDDDLPKVSTNFYYLSVKDSLKKLQELTGVEFTFKVEISGNKITDKWVEVYRELGNRTLKRFNYGTNALTVKRETNHSELYTALIGRGKGEEVGETDAGDATYGRKINFADVEWKKSAGKPVDKPKGQKYIELPQATAEFGVKMLDGRKVPRIGMVEFSDTEDPEILIEQTWQALQEYARPKVLFSATVANIGDTGIGDTVTIHRHDLNMHYKTRVRKVMRNRKNNDKTQVEIGDVVYTASTKRQSNINSKLNNMENDLSNVRDEVSHVVVSADGKNTINYGNAEPERKKVGDSWVRDHPSLAGETQWLVWNGEAWELILDTSETTLNKEAIEQAKQDIEEAKQTADEAVEQIDTAVANAGFTSLDETISSVQTISNQAQINAGTAIDNAQQAITDASNAYGLAQTSISEAQTAQANSLTALGKADNALDGVSSLDVRVDDVEAELELKADNTYMTEDGTLTTLSNAITFNANRFSSDMSRIESRVESLAGEINLVILRNAFENTYLIGDEVYPNATAHAGTDTMSEMIDVVAGEELALSKNTVDGDNTWRISFYDNSHNYVTRATTSTNQHILTIPAGATKMWVSYPTGSQPQIVRGTDFIPYRPNLADQMTTEEINIFRNEYDEFADRTERRLTAVDSSGGRLDVAENLITQNANGLTLKADQSTVDTLAGTVQSLGTEFDIVAGQVSSRVWNTDIETAIDGIEVGGRNYAKRTSREFTYVSVGAYSGSLTNAGATSQYVYTLEELGAQAGDIMTVSMYVGESVEGYGGGFRIDDQNGRNKYSTYKVVKNGYVSETFTILEGSTEIRLYTTGQNNSGASGSFDLPVKELKLEKGNKATDWTPAPEDTLARFDHIETEWTQTFDTFSQTVSDIDGRVTAQTQTIDSITDTVADHTGKISTTEQTVNGLQDTVYDPETGLTSVNTQLANLVNVAVTGEELSGALSVLEDNLNLRLVSKDEIITQINLSPENILLQANKIQALGDVVVDGKLTITDEFIAPNAQIDGAKIANATIGSAKIASLDVSKIVGNTQTFIQSNLQYVDVGKLTGNVNVFTQESFNAISNEKITVDFNGIQSRNGSNGEYARIQEGGLNFYRPDTSGVGRIGSYYDSTRTERGVSIGLYSGYGFRVEKVLTGGNRTLFDISANEYIRLGGTSVTVNSQFITQTAVNLNNNKLVVGDTVTNSNQNLDLKDNILYGASRIEVGSNIRFANDSHRIYDSNGTSLNIAADTNLNLGTNNNGSINTVMRVLSSGVQMFGVLNMQGRTITRVGDLNYDSDERLKDILGVRTEDDLATIMAINYKNYIMNGKKQRGFIAQELRLIDDELVIQNEDGYLGYEAQGYVHTIGHAVQQLAFREEDTNKVASQALLNSETNAEKIARLEKEIQKLKEAA